MISSRVASVRASLTLALTAKAKALRAEGRDVTAFTAGELDFAPPPAATEAVATALAQGKTRYTPVAGILSLREAIADQLEVELGVRYPTQDIVVSCGAKHSLHNLVQVLCNPGDELLVPSPFWLSYPAMARLASATPVSVPTGPDFKMSPEALEAAITPKSRVLILNSPANPTGAVYSEAELEGLAEVIRRHPAIVVVSDEIYDKLVFADAPAVALQDGLRRAPSFCRVAPDLAERTVVVNGVSKTYAMTGFRIGWAAGPRPVMGACTRFQSHQTSGPTSIAQAAAEAALRSGREAIPATVEALTARREAMVTGLRRIEGITLTPPQGAFYCFAKIAPLLGKTLAGRELHSALDFAEVVLEKADVALIPGDPFGAPDCVRLSFALSRPAIEAGLDKLRRFIAEALA